MAELVKRYPGLSLFVLAMVLGVLPLAIVAVGLAPPAFFQLAALSASAAGIILAAVEGGKRAVRELLRRVLIWRVGLGWWLFALLFPVVPTTGALYLAALFGKQAIDWTGIAPLYNLFPVLFLLIAFAGLGEEFGWRGSAVPRLQNRYNALLTSLIIGVLHAVWHTPLFFVEGVIQHTMAQEVGFVPAFLGYSVFILALAIQLTWLFNNTKGSVLLVAVYHGAVNAWNGYIDIYRGQMAGIYAYTALMIVVSIIVVIVYGPKNPLTHKGERGQGGLGLGRFAVAGRPGRAA